MSSNPYFKNVERAPYELGYLLQGLSPVLSSNGPLDLESRQVAEAAQSHASNANNTILDGLEAVGRLLTTGALNDEFTIPTGHLSNLGALLCHLAVEAQFLQKLSSNLQCAINDDDDRKHSTELWPVNKKASSPC